MTSPSKTVIGKFYNVPCVLNCYAGRKTSNLLQGLKWVPVIGPLHEDAEIVKFIPEHWHIDWRFVPGKIVSSRRRYYHGDVNLVNLPIDFKNAASAPTFKRRKCLRELPTFPCASVPWLAELEAAFADRRMENMICTHKGMPLADCPVVNGAVVCMGHGLRWNVRTGKLIRTQKL